MNNKLNQKVKVVVGLLAFAFLAIFAISFSSSVYAQQRLATKIDVENSRGFGRFAITLLDRTRFVEYEISSDNNVLVVRLAEPIELDILREIIPLDDFILIGRQDPEGSVLRFALAEGVRVNTMAAGEHLFLDFLPSSWRGENPSIPWEVVAKLEKRAEEALRLAQQNAIVNEKKGESAKMTMRVGRHPTFTRFVFSWNVPFRTSFKREDTDAILVFDKLGNFDFSKVNADLPPLVKAVKGILEAKTTRVTLQLEKSARVRSYIDNGEYVIDVTSDELVKNTVQNQSLPLLIGGLPVAPVEAENLSQSAAVTDETLEVVIEPETTNNSSEEQRVDNGAANDRQDAAEQNSETVSANDEAKSKPPISKPVVKAENPETVSESARNEKRGLSTVEASLNESKDALRLVFPFDRQTPSAVFRRGKAVWMVFKTNDLIDISALESLLGEFIRAVEIRNHGQYKAVRVEMPTAQLASAAIDESNWVISIGNKVIRASEPMKITRNLKEDDDDFLVVPLSEPAGSIILSDPTVGDQIHVVVANPPARGLLRQQKFVMLGILPSTHALAFIPHSNRISTHLNENGVVIRSSDTLYLSTVKGLRASASTILPTDEWYDQALEINDDSIVETAKFGEKEREILGVLLSAPEKERPRRYIELGKFYVANGYAPEALASLQRAIEVQPLLENKRAFVLSKAASEIIMRRYDDAAQTLNAESYDEDQDAAIWRTIAGAGKGDWSYALKNAAFGQARLSSYDVGTQQDFFLAAAEAALNVSDLNNSKTYLGNIVLRDAGERQRGRHEILQGKLAVAEGRFEDARFFFNRARQIEDIEVQADASLSLMMLDHDVGKVSNEESLERLEKFVAVWRNDDLELRALRELGEVLAEEEEYRRAFLLVQTAVLSDNDSDITRDIQDDMKELFVSLFHGGKADVLPAVDALSLYFDFKHLSPIGRVGDEIVRYLSRRLIDLDLLPQAAGLLAHQVDKRLKGAARARVAADLAVVELLDGHPHRALTTLQRSRSSNLSASLERQRRLVEAYALSKIDKHTVALELLASLDGEEVDRLRANINWDARKWNVAGEQLEKTHSGRWADVEPLEPHVRLDIMRAAIAFSLAKDDFALNRLSQKFGEKMSESTDATVFQILTQPLSDQSFDRDVAIDSILNIGTSESFLRDYRRRYLVKGVTGS